MSSTMDEWLRRMKGKKKPKPEPTKKLHFTMSPLLFLAREVAIRRKGAPLDIRTVTKALVDELKYAHKHNANVTCVIVGGPGKGKSKLAFLLGKMYILLTESTFKYCWDIDEIPYVPDGGWLHIDEWLIPEGKGRVIALRRVKNLFDTGRQKQISISVSTPRAPSLPFVSFEATTLAQDWDNRMNMFEIRVPLPRFDMVYIGNAIVPVGKDDDIWKKFDAEAKARKDKVWEDKGAKRIGSKLDTKKAAKEIMKWIKENKFEILSKSQVTTFVRTVAKERKWDTHYYNEADIVNWIMTFKKQETPDPIDIRKQFGEFSKEWKGLREFIEEWCLEQKPSRKEYASATALYLVPEHIEISQDDIFEMIYPDMAKAPVKVGTLTRNIRILRRRMQHPDRRFTDFTESWVASQLASLDAKKLGGKDAADIVLGEGDDRFEVAVKLTLRNDPFYDYTVSPEQEPGAVVLVIPRQLQLFVIPITTHTVVNQHLQLDNLSVQQRGVLVGIEELVETVKKMLL